MMNEDKKHNQHITDLMQMAEQGKLKGEITDPEIINAKEELIQLHRNMLAKLREIDLNKLAAKEYTETENRINEVDKMAEDIKKRKE